MIFRLMISLVLDLEDFHFDQLGIPGKSWSHDPG